jgi:nanoRNase/pAp phosphatase (c-di-AMP/oligoRNAs hydrolase)
MKTAVQERAKALVALLSGRKRLLVLTHDNPDPDSLASALALRRLAWEKLRMPSRFGLSGRVMRAENRTMVRCLGLEMVPVSELRVGDYDCLAMVDTQPGFGHTSVPEGRTIDIVIDHHVPPDGAPEVSEDSFVDIRTEIGATSSMVAEYLMDLRVPVPADVATALFYGIKTDTADLARNASPVDQRAYEFLSSRVDRKKLAEIITPDLPLQYYRTLRDALNSIRIYEHVVLCSLGKVGMPEMVAEVADLLLRLEGKQAVFCGGLVNKTYYMSVRSDLAGGRDAYDLIRDALGGEGSFGGHGMVAGGCVELPDDSPRTLKRLERRLEKNILTSMGVLEAKVQKLGGE